MGNRAVITTKNAMQSDGTLNPNATGVYLHWNGGRDSVEAFLCYCDAQEYRSPKEDETYGFARLVTVIGNFFNSGLSVGVGPVGQLDTDNWDNGTYLIDGWRIAGRLYFGGEEEEDDDLDLEGRLLAIDRFQPEGVQLGAVVIHEYAAGYKTPFH